LAGVHLACVIAAAVWILASFPHEQESPMLWIYVMLLDYPVSYLWGAVDQFMTHWPDLPFLPALANSWSAFLGPLFFFAFVGTAWWFCIGWLLGRIWTLIRRPHDIRSSVI
jgi:hypothetical protein